MARIQRILQKIFGVNAPTDDIAVLGSFKTGIPVYTNNIATLQNNAYEEGYGATLVGNEAPFMEEQNSIPYILSKQLAYLFQEGIPEYDAETTYYKGSIVKTLNEKNQPVLYYSLIDDNTGNPVTNTESWKKVELGSGSGTSLPLFTPVIQDHVLSFEETMGFALQGTYVYKTGIAGERYGYPDFIQRCFDEKSDGTASQVTLGDSTITMYTNANGHIFYDIADKPAVDAWFNTWGIAWFFGVDAENERVFLPRNNWYFKTNGQAGEYIAPTLPKFNWSISHIKTAAENPNTSGGIKWTLQETGGNEGGYYTLDAGIISFDSAASNPIYSGTTVQPPSVGSYLYIVVGNTSEVTHVTTTIPDFEIISQVNKNTSDIVDLKDNGGMPDLDNGINMGLPQYPTSTTLDTKFTPPVNGYIKIIANRRSGGNTLIGYIITPDKNTLKLFDAPAYNANFFNCFIPISKGNQFYMITDSTSNTWNIMEQKFYPMKGVN